MGRAVPGENRIYDMEEMTGMAAYKILVVEDSSIMRQLLVMALRRMSGVIVLEASDGLEALKVIANEELSLIFSDVNMPGMDGISMLKTMKKAGRKEKVILMSASPFDEEKLEPEIPSVAKHLHKPFKLDDFLGVVIDAMDSKISLSM